MTPHSTARKYYPWLDVLRGISILLVIVYHANAVPCLGPVGVGIFFAISGWLITNILIEQVDRPEFLAYFYSRRFLRIIPLYWLVVIASYLASRVVHFNNMCSETGGYDLGLAKYLPNILTFSLDLVGRQKTFLLSHTWSICVEERFYVFWPIIFGMIYPNKLVRVLCLSGLGVAWFILGQSLGFHPQPEVWFLLPFPMLFGCLLAVIFSGHDFRIRNCFTIPAACFLIAIYYGYAFLMRSLGAGPTYDPISGVIACLIILCAVVSKSYPSDYFSRILQSIGRLSYGAYLIHFVFVLIGIRIAKALAIPYLSWLFASLLCFPFAFLIYRYIEKPILAMRPKIELSKSAICTLSFFEVMPILAGLVYCAIVK
jgi:peptidoglycan/LPS O-acetylase OafA/YrhL